MESISIAERKCAVRVFMSNFSEDDQKNLTIST